MLQILLLCKNICLFIRYAAREIWKCKNIELFQMIERGGITSYVTEPIVTGAVAGS
jgi:hypothetical protein